MHSALKRLLYRLCSYFALNTIEEHRRDLLLAAEDRYAKRNGNQPCPGMRAHLIIQLILCRNTAVNLISPPLLLKEIYGYPN